MLCNQKGGGGGEGARSTLLGGSVSVGVQSYCFHGRRVKGSSACAIGRWFGLSGRVSDHCAPRRGCAGRLFRGSSHRASAGLRNVFVPICVQSDALFRGRRVNCPCERPLEKLSCNGILHAGDCGDGVKKRVGDGDSGSMRVRKGGRATIRESGSDQDCEDAASAARLVTSSPLFHW